jgi:hypothetical protein
MKTRLLLALGAIIGAGLAWLMMQAVHTNCLKARYADAVVYAGATDFVFELASGEKLSVRSSHEGIPISGSTPLLGTGHDGPAAAATDRLGRLHLLCVTKDGIKIRLEGD